MSLTLAKFLNEEASGALTAAQIVETTSKSQHSLPHVSSTHIFHTILPDVPSLSNISFTRLYNKSCPNVSSTRLFYNSSTRLFHTTPPQVSLASLRYVSFTRLFHASLPGISTLPCFFHTFLQHDSFTCIFNISLLHVFLRVSPSLHYQISLKHVLLTSPSHTSLPQFTTRHFYHEFPQPFCYTRLFHPSLPNVLKHVSSAIYYQAFLP